MRLLPSLGNFLNVGHARAVQATGRFSVGTVSSSWLVRATDGWLFFKPFVVLCRRSFIALEKIFFFFFLLSSSLSVFPSSHFMRPSWLSIMPLTFLRTDVLPSLRSKPTSWPCFSSSHFAAGSPLKTQGSSRLLSSCDMPSRAALPGRSSEVCPPHPTGEAVGNLYCQITQRLILGEEVQYFQRGKGQY